MNKGLDVRKINHIITPTDKFYQRSHLPYPEVGEWDEWGIKLSGAFKDIGRNPVPIHYLHEFESVERVVHMECTGNSHATNSRAENVKNLKRHITWKKVLKAFDPSHWKPLFTFLTGGSKHDLISNGVFTGVRLVDFLKMYPVEKGVKELVFWGADKGYDGLHHRYSKTEVHYARSLPMDRIVEFDPILCYMMNGEALRQEHGYPLRLVVPGVYGAEYVKWLNGIEATKEKHTGYFQENYYNNIIEKVVDGKKVTEKVPCHDKGPKSLVLKVRKKENEVRVFGVAWGGLHDIDHVLVRVQGGGEWKDQKSATWITKHMDHGWRWWEVRFNFSYINNIDGTVEIMPQAEDESGVIQPFKQPAELFYGNNSVVRAEVRF